MSQFEVRMLPPNSLPTKPASDDMNVMQAALQAMGLDQVSCGVLALLPMVEVAWADGTVHAKERAFIERQRDARFPIDEDGQRLLNSWLTYAPTEPYFNRGRSALIILAHDPNEDHLQPDDLAEIAALCHKVARQSGGMFGMGKVLPCERGVLSVTDCLPDDHPSCAMDVLFDHHDPGWDEPTGVHDGPVDLGTLAEPEVAWKPIVPATAKDAALVLETELETRAYPLRGDSVAIGRGPDNDVQIRFDHRVSRSHCRITRLTSGWAVEDLGSSNGVYINGKKARVEHLTDGDDLRVGLVHFSFRSDAADFAETAYDLPVYGQDGDDITEVLHEGQIVED